MNIILFNLGKNKPYFRDCIAQVKKYNPNINLFFIGEDKEYVEDTDFYNIKYLSKGENIKYFNNLDFYSKHADPLWKTSMARFFYIEEFVKKFNLKNIFHFDNDVLIYGSFNKVLTKINIDEQNIFTKTNEFNLTCGLFYTRDYLSIFKLNNLILNKISLGISFLTHKYSQARSLPEEPFMVNEMTILKIIQEENEKAIYEFPSQPFDNLFNRYGICFDPSSWGQYIGGTPNVGPGWAGNHHNIGKSILGKRYNCYLKDKKPLILDINNDKTYPLFNLHIHSKNLNKYV